VTTSVNDYVHDGLSACIFPEVTAFQPELEQLRPQSLPLSLLHRYASPLEYHVAGWNHDPEELPPASSGSIDGNYIIDR
jgi:hypothetical protein